MSSFMVSETHIASLCNHLVNIQSQLLNNWIEEMKGINSVVVDYEKPLLEEIKNLPESASLLDKAKLLGKVLVKSNMQSICYRYSHHGEVDTTDEYMALVSDLLDGKTVEGAKIIETNDTQFLKNIHCLDYQSCQRNDWDSTMAKNFIQSVSFKLGSLKETSEYYDASWGF